LLYPAVAESGGDVVTVGYRASAGNGADGIRTHDPLRARPFTNLAIAANCTVLQGVTLQAHTEKHAHRAACTKEFGNKFGNRRGWGAALVIAPSRLT